MAHIATVISYTEASCIVEPFVSLVQIKTVDITLTVSLML
jgi:hypothetical protein